MIRIKQQTVNSEDICEKVLADVFGEGYMFTLYQYDTLCTVIEKPLRPSARTNKI